MSAGDSDLRIRPGRIRSTRAPKPKSFINQVLRAAKKAGHTSASGGGGQALRSLRALDLWPRHGSALAAAACSARRGASW